MRIVRQCTSLFINKKRRLLDPLFTHLLINGAEFCIYLLKKDKNIVIINK
jgi:hypothetical protein